MAQRQLPSLFIGHGSPTIALMEDDFTRSLSTLGMSLPSPKAIVVVSPHTTSPQTLVSVNASAQPGIEFDFSGFQPELYQMTYPCPGSPELAARIATLLGGAGFQVSLERSRRLDHGAWIPLRYLYPKADIPVVQISMPFPSDPRLVLKMGRALSELRTEGVLLIGSGGVVHNLRKIVWNEKHGEPIAWAVDFKEWVRQRIEAGKIEELAQFDDLAPYAELAQPEPDHFMPVFFTLGAALKGDRLLTVFDGFHYKSLSMYSFLLTDASE